MKVAEKIKEKKEKVKPNNTPKISSSNFELILAIVNRGFSEQVITIATEKGATGGTVLTGRGTYKHAKTILGMKIEPEKELLMIVVDRTICADIIKAIYENVGLHTPGSGICFALPISSAVGLRSSKLADNSEVKI